jgi:hypothetical protein
MSLTYAQALELIGGLSSPSKMPWFGWSISAKRCITGAKLVKVAGTVCSGCYALKGRYVFPNVMAAHERRLIGSQDPQFVDAFVCVLTNLHARTRKRRKNGCVENRFRWFDSGDLQSVEMLDKIVQIAEQTPQIQHWLPTREWAVLRAYDKLIPPNLVIRVSEARIGVRPKLQPLGLPYSTVGCEPAPDLHNCPALSRQGNRCLDCDACWQRINVNYELH